MSLHERYPGKWGVRLLALRRKTHGGGSSFSQSTSRLGQRQALKGARNGLHAMMKLSDRMAGVLDGL
jgi:hypothetical protein